MQRALGVAVVAVACAACGSDDRPAPAASPEVGHALADGVATAVGASVRLRAPFRCAALDASAGAGGAAPATLTVAGRTVAIDGDVAHIGAAPRAPRDTTVVLGVVADARGATAATLAQIAAIRAAFAAAKVELVVSLGGMGATEVELTEVLRALADGGAWPVWAIAGDRESVPAHRAAVAGLAAAGAAVLDGTRLRLLDIDGAMLASFPGAPHPGQLLAADAGCVHAAGDAAALAVRLAAHKGVRVWAGHAPPRQGGDTAGDRSLGGVHVGALGLAGALPAARPHLVLHGLVDQAALGALTGLARLTADGSAPVVLGAGPAESMPIPGPRGPAAGGGALVVRVSEHTLAWKRVRLPLPGSAGRVDRSRARQLR